MFKKLLLIALAVFMTIAHSRTLLDSVGMFQHHDRLIQVIQEDYGSHLNQQETSTLVKEVLVKSSERDLDPTVVLGLIAIESRFNPSASSSHGARGLMQVMPRYHKAKINARSLYDIRTSVDVGTLILRECMDRSKDNHRVALNCYSGKRGNSALKYQNKVLNFARVFQDAIFKT